MVQVCIHVVSMLSMVSQERWSIIMDQRENPHFKKLISHFCVAGNIFLIANLRVLKCGLSKISKEGRV
jgi:hypothetical protein